MPYSGGAVTEIYATSDAEQCSRLRHVVSRLAEYTLRSRRAAEDVELALGEALSNAVKYGERGSKVRLRVECISPRELAVELAYPGGEFDTCVNYPCDPASGNGGFGRFIMQQLTDGMEYSFKDGLTTLRLVMRPR